MNKIFIVLLLFFSTSLLAQNGVFYIAGTAVKQISMSMAVSAIDFGDVYTDSNVDSIPVTFTVNAEAGYFYTVEITNDDNTGVVQVSSGLNGPYTDGLVTYIDRATGVDQTHDFYVGLNTSKLVGDLSAVITVMVAYNDIAI